MNHANPTSIHGHEVLHLLIEADPPHTRQTLADAVREKFGPDARFHACSAQGMTLDGLLTFLAQRGKYVERDGRLHADAGRMCQHTD